MVVNALPSSKSEECEERGDGLLKISQSVAHSDAAVHSCCVFTLLVMSQPCSECPYLISPHKIAR